MDEQYAGLLKKQLFWQKITALLLACLLLVLVVGLILIGGFLSKASNLVMQADSIAARLDSAAAQMTDVDWKSVGENLESISADLSAVDWLDLTDRVGTMAQTAEESLQVAQQAINDLDIETLNEAITELRDVIEPLSKLVNVFR